MGRVLKTKFICGFGYRQSGCEFILYLPDYKLTYHTSQTFSGHLFYKINEIIDRHAKMLGTDAHRRKPVCTRP